MKKKRLFHLTTRDAWRAARRAGVYRAASLETEGFIHLSTEEQWQTTLLRFFAGQLGIVLLAIDPSKLSADVRYENADGDRFPHLYGPLEVEAVVEVRDFDRQDVLDAIERAFADARMPKTTAELAYPSIDAPAVVEHFFGRTRDDVETGDFMGSLHMEDFMYMTDEAVLYYLPCVLRIMLDEPDDEDWIFIGGFLRGIVGTYPHSSLTGLNAAQREAIAVWADRLAIELENHEWLMEVASEAIDIARLYREEP